MAAKTLSGRGVAGKATRARAARPSVADEAWWLAFAVIAALLVALHTFL